MIEGTLDFSQYFDDPLSFDDFSHIDDDLATHEQLTDAEIVNEVLPEVVEVIEDDQGEAEPLVTAKEAMRAAKILEVYFEQDRIQNNDGLCFS